MVRWWSIPKTNGGKNKDNFKSIIQNFTHSREGDFFQGGGETNFWLTESRSIVFLCIYYLQGLPPNSLHKQREASEKRFNINIDDSAHSTLLALKVNIRWPT